jgi:hypothetical protein
MVVRLMGDCIEIAILGVFVMGVLLCSSGFASVAAG